MKILEVMCSFAPGGVERFVVDLCNEMSLHEDVTLMTLKDNCIRNNSFYKNELDKRVKYTCMDWKDGFHFIYLIKIIFAIKKLNPEIVHFHGAARNYLILANLFLGHRIKFVQTIHNDVYRGYTNFMSKVQIGMGRIFGKLKFVTISRTNYEQFAKVYPKCKQEMILNGRGTLRKSEKYDEVKAYVDSFKKDDNTIVFLHIARCNKQKNQELLIRSFNKIIEEGANVALIMIGGDFDSELGISLKGIANHGIYIIGTHNNVADYMYCSDAFILSSSFEGMPITVIEALLCGLPVISTPVSGSIDLVENGVNGVISNDYSLNEFIRAIKEFISKKEKIKENTQHDLSSTPLSIESCCKKYLNYFRNI